jgi:hypothetical protein
MLCCAVCSFANGRAWVLDTSSSTWKGYKVTFTETAKPRAKQLVQPAAAATVMTGSDKESCPIAME